MPATATSTSTFNVMPPTGLSAGEVRERGTDLLDGLYGIVRGFSGSFSAEHGVGRSRREVYWEWLTPEHRKTIAAIKAAFDPLGIMNPGCLIPD
ncbi:FAD-linked oxidase C-terminal domain-containing protein [Mesorhizobium sp. STM 4661]|uniref:FAD-binding oxidoreductase n=1 Tax=Mesorhizobium sp. STM 4661 TaxID=1297570 RepID=UPI0003A18E34|nr:FAD-linked oxidase C-terminal domain-containing protein [Mesorhizobium sp. STM 4661]